METCSIHTNRFVGEAQSQITLDDDYNLPDYRPDIRTVIRGRGEVRLDEVKAQNGAVWVKGSMPFWVLYRCEGNAPGALGVLNGEVSFQEKINIRDLKEGDEAAVSGKVEDITIGVINSRKLSVRAVLAFEARAWRPEDVAFTTGWDCEGEYFAKTEEIEVLALLFGEKDLHRQKAELALPSSKPNVHEILWKSVELRNVQSFAKGDAVGATGEIQVAVLYSEEESESRLQWYETTVPLECRMECGCDAEEDGAIAQIAVALLQTALDVKPDYDGEERIFVLEITAELSVRIWREEHIRILRDVYAQKSDLIPVRNDISFEQLLLKNSVHTRVTEQMERMEHQGNILQICSCEGSVAVERTELSARGLKVEGVITAELMYITTDDGIPVETTREIYPFEQWIELPDANDEVRIELATGLEQLSASMLDQEHVEIKAQIKLDLMAFRTCSIPHIEEVREEPLDREQLETLPGIVGYLVREGDDLWTIAKTYRTTEQKILETNGKTDRSVARGEKLLIVKEL